MVRFLKGGKTDLGKRFCQLFILFQVLIDWGQTYLFAHFSHLGVQNKLTENDVNAEYMTNLLSSEVIPNQSLVSDSKQN